jgi:hypothetical protein
MKFTGPMYVGCLIALCLGIMLVFPILYFAIQPRNMPERPLPYPNPQSSVSQIAANLAYINVDLVNYTYRKSNSTEIVTIPNVSNVTVIVNVTKYCESDSAVPEAEVDYFRLDVFAQNGTGIKRITLAVFASYPNDLTPEQIANLTRPNGSTTFFKLPQDLTRVTNRITQYSAILTEASMTMKTNSVDVFGGNETQLIKASSALNITLTRIGSVVLNGNSVLVHSEDAGIVESIRLTRQGNGFLYIKEGYSFPTPKPHYP